jgi:hypothetical protein
VLPALERFLELKKVDQEDEWRCAVFARRRAGLPKTSQDAILK